MKKFVLLLLTVATVIISSCSKEPDAEKIKADLIGQRIEMGGLNTWSFDSMSEFKNFEILSKQKNKHLLEYEVRIHLIDSRGNSRVVKARIVYHKENGNWKFRVINRIPD